MLNAHRIGDLNSAGGAIISTPQSSVLVNGIPLSVIGADVAPHTPYTGSHLTPVVATGSPNVLVNGIPATRLSDIDSCGHPRVFGSPNVFIN